MDHARLMDRVYRYQRHIYDLTRKYFLLGRDRLIRQMAIAPGASVLEVGCGTARNTLMVARKHPQARLFGLDISAEMLRTAQGKISRAGVEDVCLVECGAEQYDYRETFGADEPFDVIFFSYSLTMIPPWQEAIETAMKNLKPNGAIYIVDFWDQRDLPKWFRRILVRWLDMFHVRHKPEMISYLQGLQASGEWTVSLEPVMRRYALIAKLSRTNAAAV